MANTRRSAPEGPDRVDVSLRDEQANREVEEILSGLPADHPARLKFAEGRPTVELTHLVKGHPDLVRSLIASMDAFDDRIWHRPANRMFRP